MARRGRGDGRVRRALEDGGIAWWGRWVRSVRWTGQAGGGPDYGPPRSNRRGREKGAEKKSPPDAARLPRGSGGALPVHVSSLIGLLSSRRV